MFQIFPNTRDTYYCKGLSSARFKISKMGSCGVDIYTRACILMTSCYIDVMFTLKSSKRLKTKLPQCMQRAFISHTEHAVQKDTMGIILYMYSRAPREFQPEQKASENSFSASNM